MIMRIFYTCTTEGLVKDYEFHRNLVSYIKKKGHKLIYEWIDDAYKNITKGVIGDTEKFYIHKQNGIKSADAVLVEGSYKSFSLGHQITIASQKAKPTLLLFRQNPKNSSKKSMHIEGIRSAWLVQQKYSTEKEAHDRIDKFLKMYQDGKKYRFNLVLSQPENYFLEEKMNASGKTKTQIIKEIIKKEMVDS